MIRLLLELAFCVFILFGSKLILGAFVIWWLIPADARCVCCDAPLLPLEAWAGSTRLLRGLGLERRWCMECGRESMGRRVDVRRAGGESAARARFLSRRATG